jgi:hypothetical protein
MCFGDRLSLRRLGSSVGRMATGRTRAASSALCLGILACGNPPATRVLEAKEVGIVSQSRLIAGRDGGGSALLWGRSVWAFGDTVSSVPDTEGQTWHNNSFSFSPDLSASHGVVLTERTESSGAPAYLIAPTSDEAAFIAAHRGNPCEQQPCGARFAAWPGPPLFDAARNRALVPYGLVWAAPGDFNFHGVGQSFAVWTDFSATPERPVVSPSSPHPTLLFTQGEPAFGSTAAIDGDELFAFGCVRDGLTFHCLLAKVQLDVVFDRTAWLFWNGASWSKSLTSARPVFDASSIVSVQFNAYLGHWTAIYSAVLSNDVMIRTAPALVGPWSEAMRLFTADRRGMGGTSYDAQAHAEYAENSGQVLYVSYSRPNGNGPFGAEFALERVSLEKAPSD